MKNGKFKKTRILIHDLELESIDKYKEEGKKDITLNKMTYLDIELAYDGQEIEDISFNEDGQLLYTDNRGNLYETDFNANEYGLNKNASVQYNDAKNIFENIAESIEEKIDYIHDFFDGEEKEEKKQEEQNQEYEKNGKDPIEIPSGLGKIKTFEAWDYPMGNVGSHWDYSSKQYEFWKKADGLNSFDSDGFGVVNGSYVVAVTSTFGNVGDFIIVELENGTKIPCVIGDEKNQDDPGCNKYGHINGQCILEFMGKTSKWYGKGFGDPTMKFKPEWYGEAVVRITNTGVNYLKNPEYVSSYEEKDNTDNKENKEKLTYEEFEKDLWTNKTVAIFDSEGTRDEWKKAIKSKEENGTKLYAQNGSKPKDWYNKFKEDKNFLKGKEHILVEVGPNDLNDWNSMEKLLDLLVERRDSGAKIYFEQIESTSGCKDISVINAFNQHLKEYQDTHENCYYIETREYPNNLLDEDGKVKYCDSQGLHFKEGLKIKDDKGAYELWAENTAHAIYEVNKREYSEIEFLGFTIDEDNVVYKVIDFVDDLVR